VLNDTFHHLAPWAKLLKICHIQLALNDTLVPLNNAQDHNSWTFVTLTCITTQIGTLLSGYEFKTILKHWSWYQFDQWLKIQISPNYQKIKQQHFIIDQTQSKIQQSYISIRFTIQLIFITKIQSITYMQNPKFIKLVHTKNN